MKGPKFLQSLTNHFNALISNQGGRLVVVGSSISLNHVHQVIYQRFVRPTLDEESQRLEYVTQDKYVKDKLNTMYSVTCGWLANNGFDIQLIGIYTEKVMLVNGHYHINPDDPKLAESLAKQGAGKLKKGTRVIIENNPFSKQDFDFQDLKVHFEKMGCMVEVISYN